MHRTPANFTAADFFTAAILSVGYVASDLRTTTVFVSDFLKGFAPWLAWPSGVTPRPSGADKTPSDLSWPVVLLVVHSV